METATSWISKTPGVCGGRARVRNTRHTVHGLVEWKRQGVSDEKLLTMFDPPLTRDDLDATWRYADKHPEQIARALWADRAVMVEHGPGSPPPSTTLRAPSDAVSDDPLASELSPPAASACVRRPSATFAA